MDSYQFYKSLYDRELNRRKDLDAAVNLPITILTILVAGNSYLISIENPMHCNEILSLTNMLLASVFITFLISVFFLVRSYNNMFKGFGYTNLGFTKEIRNFEINEIPKYNDQVEESEKMNFENHVIEKLTEYTDDHIAFNDKRQLDLYKAKTFIILTLLLTGVKFLIIAIKYLIP